ncbi:MAG: HEAT repeat domain-containing protein [Clostridiales bacterium]|nr:HEAT repeat domain-containing protein [Clostridiales bacterium]
MIKDKAGQEQFRKVCGGNYDVIMKCLVDDDPKVRKNAASVLGTLAVPEAVDVLMDAYEAEETLFVRPEYVTAMAALDCSEYLAQFYRRLDELQSYDAPENERKHIQAEISALRELLLQKEGMKKHAFCGHLRPNTVILTTLPAFRDALAAGLPFQKKLVGGGVRTTVTDMNLVLTNRLWQEMLFCVDCSGTVPVVPEQVARSLMDSDLTTILTENYRGEAPFYFRVGIAGAMPRGRAE